MAETTEPIAAFQSHFEYGDYRRYYLYWCFRERTWLRLALLTLGGLGLMHLRRYESDWIVPPILILFLWLFFLLRPRIAWRQIRVTFQAPVAYVFYEDHLTSHKSDRGCELQTTAQYTRYEWAAERKTAFYLKTPEKSYVTLPKHCMTPEQAEALRALFARQFGERFDRKPSQLERTPL
ncbi:MAG: YcxB family protein [Oscillospiraceae bacterium]|jgi:hypothetical protein|nr:YcxB family protein [Oscillospiraceae bacterium]